MLCSFSVQFIFFSEQRFYGKLFDIRFSYKHCNFSGFCPLVKMASKNVTRSIQIKHRDNQAYDTTAQTSVRSTQRLFSVKLPFRRSKLYCPKISFEKGKNVWLTIPPPKIFGFFLPLTFDLQSFLFFTFYYQDITIIFWKGSLKFRYRGKTFPMILTGPITVADVTQIQSLAK